MGGSALVVEQGRAGSGDGYGYGYGYGSGLLTQAFADHPLIKNQAVRLAFWRSDTNGHAANGGRTSEPARPGLVQQVAGPLKLCTERALHGSLRPDKWSGDRWWVVALHEPVAEDGDKIGSLKRTIIAELT